MLAQKTPTRHFSPAQSPSVLPPSLSPLLRQAWPPPPLGAERGFLSGHGHFQGCAESDACTNTFSKAPHSCIALLRRQAGPTTNKTEAAADPPEARSSPWPQTGPLQSHSGELVLGAFSVRLSCLQMEKQNTNGSWG